MKNWAVTGVDGQTQFVSTPDHLTPADQGYPEEFFKSVYLARPPKEDEEFDGKKLKRRQKQKEAVMDTKLIELIDSRLRHYGIIP